MPSFDFTAAAATAVNLGKRHWSDEARRIESLIGWWTLHSDRWTEDSGRIIACAPRAGNQPLTMPSGSLGPIPAMVGGLSCADFTNGQLNGLYCETASERDNLGLAAILWLGATPQAQNRDLLGVYGNGDAMRIWRTPVGQWSWRGGSTDAAAITRAWAEGPLMILADRIGTTCSLRLRDRAGTTAIMSGTLTTASVSPAPRVVFGQDEISDGHANAAPNASRTWSEYIMEAAVYRGAAVTNPAVVAFWDDYFTTVYGTTA